MRYEVYKDTGFYVGATPDTKLDLYAGRTAIAEEILALVEPSFRRPPGETPGLYTGATSSMNLGPGDYVIRKSFHDDAPVETVDQEPVLFFITVELYIAPTPLRVVNVT